MPFASIHPQPTTGTREVATQRETRQGHVDCAYEDDATDPLPIIDVKRTLAGKLCGRVDDIAFNERVILFTQQVDLYMHGVASIFLVSCLSLFFIANVPARTAMSYINGITGMLVLVHGFASLSWDMLRLVLGSFEFWFLYVINTANNVWFNMLFHDHRMVAMVVTGASFVLSLCADANVYTRRFATRLLVIASPGLLFGLTVTALHFPPDLHYRSFHLLGLHIDAVDLLVNGNLVISYFTAVRVVRSQHLVLSSGPIGRIACDLYFPVCHLVPAMRRQHTSRTITTDSAVVKSHPPHQQMLELVHNTTATQGILASHVLLPRVVSLLARWRRAGTVLNITGASGLVLSLVAFVGDVASSPTARPHNHAFPLTLVGLLCSLGFVCVYVAHAQRTLAIRILQEIDAWFVSLQLSLVTLAACDVLHWDLRRMLVLLAAYVWGHWLLLLDALPPVTRRRLSYSPRFTLGIAGGMLVFPVLLGYFLYFSRARATLHNRVVVDAVVGGVAVRADAMGFLASKLFTLGAWMGRVFWRELRRPPNAFKLIKHRVFYRVPV